MNREDQILILVDRTRVEQIVGYAYPGRIAACEEWKKQDPTHRVVIAAGRLS